MVLNLPEAIAAIKDGKRVYAHAGGSTYPLLTINEQDELLLDGRIMKASEMTMIFECDEDPSWLLMQVLHALMRGSDEVFETKGSGGKCTAYISGSDDSSRFVTIAVPKYSTNALTAQWIRAPQ